MTVLGAAAGAMNKMSQLSAEELERGVICASAGNHAQVRRLLLVASYHICPQGCIHTFISLRTTSTHYFLFPM